MSCLTFYTDYSIRQDAMLALTVYVFVFTDLYLDALDDVELVKEKLNDLVAKSVARTEGRKNNVVFVKTHKTGSTTLASVVYRYGLRHGLRVARFDVEGTAVTLDHAAEQVREAVGVTAHVKIHIPVHMALVCV